MADKKSEIERENPEDSDKAGRVDVLTNAVRRLDNRFRGRPNDPSLIGEDMPDEDEEDDAEGADDEREDDPDKDDDWPEPKGTKLW